MIGRLSIAAFLAVTLLAAAPPTGTNEVRMVVLGVVAPSATFGLNKHLLGIPGVQQVRFDLMHGIAALRLAPGAVVTDEQLRAAVRSASYTPGPISRDPAGGN